MYQKNFDASVGFSANLDSAKKFYLNSNSLKFSAAAVVGL